MPVLCSRSSQTSQLLASLSGTIGTGIRVLRRHHVAAVHPGIRRALLLSMMLLMVLLLLPVGSSGRVVLGRWWDLLMLVLRACRRTEGNLRRCDLLVVLLVLCRCGDGQRSGGHSVGRLG